MRLHRLRVSAFLAFAGEQEVDFDALGESGLFLLQGRTGAGKTALLDAICFAFYGDVPGLRGEGVRLRSDHAAAGTPTEVELEATLRGRRIRVTRAPEQERPKLRGEGMTTEAHRVRVVAIAGHGGETVLATRHDDARAELGDLLGLTREQFCQVVLLPQGGFARFLHARSDEREALLRELFDVGRFAAVERRLKDRKHDAREAAELAGQAVREVLARAAQEAEAELPEPDAEPAALREWLDERLVVAEASAATAQEACAEAGRRRAEAADALVRGRALAERRRQHREAVAALAAWEGARAGRDAAEAELSAAHRAAPAQALAEALGARESAEVAARAAAEAAARAALAGGARAEDPAPAAWRAAAAELRRSAGAAEAQAGRERELESAEAGLARLQAVAREREGTVAALAAQVAEAQEARPGLEAALIVARDASSRLAGLVAGAGDARARARSGAERDRLQAEVAPLRERLLDAREAAVRASERHTVLLERRLAGIAAELAGHLVHGEPCTVCGSTEHPAPAPAPEGGMVDAAVVAEAGRERRAREDRRDLLAGEVARLDADLAAAAALAGDVPLGDLRTAADAAAGHAAETERLAAGVEAAGRALADAVTAAERAAARRGEAEVAAARARAEAAERAASLEADRSAVAAARAGAGSIAERVTALNGAADAAERAADALERAATSAAEAAEARARAAGAARAAGFPDVAALRAALRDDAACETLERRVRDWDARLAELRAAAGREDLVSAAALPAPDVAALEESAARALDAAERAQRAVATTSRRREALEALRGSLDRALAVAGPARERAALVREVADLAAAAPGSSNRLRMRLSAYVLAARLEDVAAAATVRLQRMSDGRYALEHTDEVAGRGRRGGLDLRVVDAWTGRDRAPGSLSGGETFLASLALALGLADVVTAEAGGARLDTLFVDEGFGSLDDEGTLDEVLSVLDGLRDGGRVVGVVSHVAELRQRIPVQLRVEKGRGGSHLVPPHALAASTG